MASNLLCIVLVTRQSPLMIDYVHETDFGDSTGYGAHGDYLFGWKEGALERAMTALGTNCFSETCPVLKLQSTEELQACTKAQQAVEDNGTNSCESCYFLDVTYN